MSAENKNMLSSPDFDKAVRKIIKSVLSNNGICNFNKKGNNTGPSINQAITTKINNHQTKMAQSLKKTINAEIVNHNKTQQSAASPDATTKKINNLVLSTIQKFIASMNAPNKNTVIYNNANPITDMETTPEEEAAETPEEEAAETAE